MTDIVETQKKPLKISIPLWKNWGKKRNISLVFNPQMKSWLIVDKRIQFPVWQRSVDGLLVHAPWLEYCGRLLQPFCTLCCRVSIPTHCVSFLAPYSRTVCWCYIYTNSGLKAFFFHQKWRNFDKNSLKAFKQIEAKKMKALQNTFWGDFKKA